MTYEVVKLIPEVKKAEWVGKPIRRYEDARLIKGEGQFIDDLKLPDMLYAALLRSPYAHAVIKKIDKTRAEAMPGVVAVVTGDDIARLTAPYPQIAPPPADKIKDYCMAVGKTRYVGEPVAAVVATDRYTAYDALELIDVEYEVLPPVIDAERAMEEGAPILHEEVGSNVVWHGVYSYGDVEEAFRKADVVIEEKVKFDRYSAVPLETNGVVASYDANTDVLTLYCNNQMPTVIGFMISVALNKPLSKIRIIAKDIGGGFGTKINSYVYMTLMGLLSMITNRPVKWTETRQENLQASTHCNERTFYVEAAFSKGGELLALKAKAIDDVGAYPRYEPLGAVIWAQVSPNMYRVKNILVDFYSVVSNKCPTGPVRGYSRLQHMWMIERIMDIAARRLGLDVAEMRRRNFIRPDEMPYETPSGCVYDGGDYPGALEKLLSLIEYRKWRAIQEKAREEGRLIGIGIGATLDSGTNNFGQSKIINPYFPMSGGSEAAWVKIDSSGGIIAALSSTPQGQGHETVGRQIVADELGVHPDQVVIVTGFDSFLNPSTGHSGTYASRFAVVGATALAMAARRVREKVLAIASHALGEAKERLTIENGTVKSIEDSSKSMPLWQVANLAWSDIVKLPRGMEPGLFAHAVYAPEFTIPDPKEKRANLTLTYSYQLHAAVVEVDKETGEVKILDYAIVDDCGRQINPTIVKGQVQGSAYLAIAATLYETMRYGEDGQLLTSTFMDYLAPTASDVPMIIKLESIETPSLTSPLGTRGVGEGGGSPFCAIASAVDDALYGLGVVVKNSHINPYNLWEQIKTKRP